MFIQFLKHVLREANPDAASSGGASRLTLGQAADQIGGLNLFGDPEGGAPDEGKKPGRKGATPEDDDAGGDAGGDDESGKRKHKPESGEDDDAENDEGDGNLEGDAEGDEDGKQSDSQDDEGEGEGENDTAGEDGEQPEIKTLEELAKALEVDDEFLSDLQVTFRADGEDVTVTLAELRRGYQRDANYRRQTQELAEARRTLETDFTQRQQHYENQLVQLGHVLQQGEALLVGEINTAEMQRLRQTNPAEWAARREEIGQRINGVKQLYAHAARQFDEFNAQRQQQTALALAELRRQEMTNLQTAIPEWGDDVRDKLTGYLDTSFGYSEQELSNVFDSRLIVIANKARLYDEMQALGAKTKKKVVKLPRVQKPSKGAKRPESSGGANVRKARETLKKTGKVKDAAALIGLAVKDL